jgi:TetR/AcrR family transcriptional regulator, cholesterol catabolism regulator
MRADAHGRSAMTKRASRPSSPAPAKPPADDTRRQILDAAANLLRRNGYASTSLRDIAAATGMKAGSLYYHFASKEEIAETVMAEGIDLVRAAVKQALAGRPADADPLENIEIAVRAHLQALHESGDYASANIRCFNHVPDEIKQRLRKVRERYNADWRKLIGQARNAGSLDSEIDDEALRYGLFGVMNWTLEWLRPGGPLPDDLGAMFFRILFRGAARPSVRD